MTLLLLPDCLFGLVALAGLALAFVLLDKVTGRILAHLDRVRQITYQAGLDAIAVIRSWEQAKADTERQRTLLEFEERTLAHISQKDALDLLRQHRREMRVLK